MFTDRVTLELFAGKGGNGIVAWRREKYLPKGGPYGGDGGKGGSIILEVDHQIPSLDAYRNKRLVKAESGGQGGPNNRRGKNGRDLILKVPCGTLIKDADSGEILYDLTEDKERQLICVGGKGGYGNTHFKSPTNRAPNTATPGRSGQTRRFEFELKLIADVGLVGFPNAGKSTLMSKATDVRVKIAPYPFTTLHPNLGYVMGEYEERILLADIPGIIRGAHENRGLGFEFLRHIERTELLLFVIDGSSEDPVNDFKTLQQELYLYNPKLLEKEYVIALNKVDLGESSFPGENVFPVSALTGQGVDNLIGFLKRKLNKYISPEKRAIVAPAGQSSR